MANQIGKPNIVLIITKCKRKIFRLLLLDFSITSNRQINQKVIADFEPKYNFFQRNVNSFLKWIATDGSDLVLIIKK